jgi:hypothetical protein
MKTPVIVLVIIFVGCGVKNERDAERDTLSYNDTTAISDEADSIYATPADGPEIRSALATLINAQASKPTRHFTLRLSASGYKYRTDEVWTFDSLLTLSHCYQDWHSDGTEGNSHHFFRQERLYAMKEESTTDGEKEISIYHAELGGIRYADFANQKDTVVETLNKKYLTNSENELKTRFAKIVTLLQENQKGLSDGDPATLRIENDSVDEEMPGKEITEITVDRKLLRKLLK